MMVASASHGGHTIKSAVRLYRDKSHKFKSKPQRTPKPWVDISDDSERRTKDEKNPLKRNGSAPNGPELSTPSNHRRKKARHSHSQSNGPAEDTLNRAGPSSASKKSALQEQRRELPIAQGREALVEEIRKNDVTVLLGETGSGKTTRASTPFLRAYLACLMPFQRFRNIS